MEKPVLNTHRDWKHHNALRDHKIVLATLGCGMEVALDPTGIQFGWKESMAPWSAYQKHRVYKGTSSRDLESELADIECVQSTAVLLNPLVTAGVLPDGTVVKRKGRMLMETVVLSLQRQLKERFGGVTEFLRLKGGEFTTAQTAVVEAAKRGLTMLAGEINLGAEATTILVPAGGSGGSNNLQADMEMVIIWFNRSDGKAARGDVEKLRRLWTARWDEVIGLGLPPAPAN
jgi:hypothetical protein